jgi:hypothetical protein
VSAAVDATQAGPRAAARAAAAAAPAVFPEPVAAMVAHLLLEWAAWGYRLGSAGQVATVIEQIQTKGEGDGEQKQDAGGGLRR